MSTIQFDQGYGDNGKSPAPLRTSNVGDITLALCSTPNNQSFRNTMKLNNKAKRNLWRESMPFMSTQNNNLFDQLGSTIDNKNGVKEMLIRDGLKTISNNRYPNKTSY